MEAPNTFLGKDLADYLEEAPQFIIINKLRNKNMYIPYVKEKYILYSIMDMKTTLTTWSTTQLRCKLMDEKPELLVMI